MLLDFIKGIALLLSLCLLQGFSVRLFGRHKQLEQLVSGLLFGGICVIGMMTPVQLAPGVIFDARTVILSMAGLFGGTTVALIAGTIAGAYRFWLGGDGCIVGLATIVTCIIFGLTYQHANKNVWSAPLLQEQISMTGLVCANVFGVSVGKLSLPAPR